MLEMGGGERRCGIMELGLPKRNHNSGTVTFPPSGLLTEGTLDKGVFFFIK